MQPRVSKGADCQLYLHSLRCDTPAPDLPPTTLPPPPPQGLSVMLSYAVTRPDLPSFSCFLPLFPLAPHQGLSVMLSRESSSDPPQTYLRTFTEGGRGATERVVTAFPHPYPQVRLVHTAVHPGSVSAATHPNRLTV